jgi:hypothetical protein
MNEAESFLPKLYFEESTRMQEELSSADPFQFDLHHLSIPTYPGYELIHDEESISAALFGLHLRFFYVRLM